MLAAVLTGDVGAGKSTLLGVWRDMGACVVCADEIAKAQWSRPEIMRAIVARWGDGVLRDGRPDFAAIASHAFANEEEHRFTNELIHPPTRAEITRLVRSARGWTVAEIPLLFEAGVHDWVDCIIYATAPLAARAVRNAARGWDEAEITRREKHLLDSGEKIKKSDIVMTNDGTLEEWLAHARELGDVMLRASGVCELHTCCGSRDEAERIASILVDNRLAACVNIGDVASIYRWNGEICLDSECALTCKTTASARREAISCIKANHSYDLPAITTTELAHSDFATLRWVAENCV